MIKISSASPLVVLFTLVFSLGVIPTSSADNYANKTLHDSGDPEYKHSRKSYTSPFDYAPCVERPVRELPKPVPVPAPAAPKANQCNQFTFDASKSYDIDKQAIDITWDFGDGTTSKDAVVTHTYEKAGEYTVLLTVKDNSGLSCDSNIATTRVRANYPPVVNAGDDQKVCVGETVRMDGSRTTSSAAGKYTWDFGDGTSGDGMLASHSYDKPGTYRVALTVDDGLGTTCSIGADSAVVSVGDRPLIQLQGPESVCTGRPASFVVNTSSPGLKYRWDFGDGTSVEGGNAMTHAYQKGGAYTVTVVADNGQSFSCSTAIDSVKVRVNSTPIADAGENLVCCVGKESFFDGSASSDPDFDLLTYHWDFGDGTSAEGAKVSHIYEKSGVYRVVFTVKDSTGSDCGVSSDSFTATVNTRPEAVLEVR